MNIMNKQTGSKATGIASIFPFVESLFEQNLKIFKATVTLRTFLSPKHSTLNEETQENG